MRIDKNMNIKYNQKNNTYQIFISFKKFTNQLENLSKSNIFFSTYKQNSTVDGFIALSNSLYFRFLIIHKLGSIVKIDDNISNRDLVKIKIDTKKQDIIISIFPEVFKELSLEYFENKFSIKYPLLNNFYIDLSLASNKEFIMDRWDKFSTPNHNALNKDLKESDINRFNMSQNTDGGRKKNEFLTDSFLY
ncbi:hypothetical protein JOC25_002398 [Solibacillus kalamii]|uniref:Uncharacterized protein n=1 Tax=Solibacillus kalamii TaxID=1748298 RepID=A0ABX3ZGY1_9BACL|nr:hypothetical protein [Solibacillus kalamii]MBM7665905.1 hypothetical protein [Solibacillus kalamii]OUZ38663.1 hypothetical protein CBM15_11140 [Solibacillus kalamii]